MKSVGKLAWKNAAPNQTSSNIFTVKCTFNLQLPWAGICKNYIYASAITVNDVRLSTGVSLSKSNLKNET